MAVDLVVEATGFLCQKTLNFQDLLRKTKMNYGSYDPYFKLTEENPGDIGLLYNPKRLARGIYFDGTEMNEGRVKMSFNLPTTPSEIDDLIRLATEIKVQYKNVSLSCDGVTVNIDDFVSNKAHYLDYSLATLRGFCETQSYEAAILTLVHFPYTLTPDEMVYFSKDGTLEEFEILLHGKQTEDVYYATPNIMRKEDTGEVVAFYTVAEGCAGVYPVECSCFLSVEQNSIEKGYVRFYIDKTESILDGYFDYNNFAKLLTEWGAEYFDGDHLLIPALEYDEIIEITNTLKEMPVDDVFSMDLDITPADS